MFILSYCKTKSKFLFDLQNLLGSINSSVVDILSYQSYHRALEWYKYYHYRSALLLNWMDQVITFFWDRKILFTQSKTSSLIFILFLLPVTTQGNFEMNKTSTIDKLTLEFHNKNDNFEAVRHVSNVHRSSSVKRS